MAQDGYAVSARATGGRRGAEFIAVAFEGGDGSSALRVYRVENGRARIAYMEPNPTARIALSAIHNDGRLSDLAGDGTRVIAYSLTFPGTQEQALVVLKAGGGKVSPAGSYRFGAFWDLDGDGRPELVSRERPLGQFFSVECESFRAMAQTAFQPRVYSWSGGRLVPASARFPGYFQSRIAELQKELAAKDPREVESYGDYLGSSLSLYFAERELGGGREAWGRFRSRFPVRPSDPAAVRRCMGEMESKLRSKLAIPPDW